MTHITLDPDPTGYPGFPAGYSIVGRSYLGDPLAVDAQGRVWSFAHGAGAWSSPTQEFTSLEALHAFVAFQDNCRRPSPDETLEQLQSRKGLVEQFAKEHRKSGFVREELKALLAELRDEIADRKFWSSKRGRNLTARQELGKRCEEVLRTAGAPGEWMIRAHADDEGALMAVGVFTAPWTEARVLELLRPILGKFELVCRQRPTPKG